MSKLQELVDQYHLAGLKLYGQRGQEASTPRERLAAKWLRRRIEQLVPNIRKLEEEAFGNVERARSTPVPQLLIQFLPDTEAGNVSYPGGSWRRHERIHFTNMDEMRDILARLVLQGIVDIDTTRVVAGGSALPLLTMMRQTR